MAQITDCTYVHIEFHKSVTIGMQYHIHRYCLLGASYSDRVEITCCVCICAYLQHRSNHYPHFRRQYATLLSIDLGP